jgi:hypothetical protein
MSAIGRFTSQGVTDLEKDADLAIFLVDFLESRRDPASGAWPGERETRRLQNTCHIVEALSELQLGLISDRLVDPAAKWLADLPLLRDLLPQDRKTVRLFPIRFKTLAALNRFEGGRLRDDFAELCKYADPHTGWLADLPGEFSRVMNSMIWADTLLCLKGHGCDEGLWRPHLDRALAPLAAAFEEWAAAPSVASPPKPHELKGLREAAYTFESLVRADRSSPESPQGRQLEKMMVDSILHKKDDVRKTLYYGLNLAHHFSAGAAARAAVSALVDEVRARYEAGDLRTQPEYFHAIVLRLLAAHYGGKLREAILDTLWLRNQQAAAREAAKAESQQRAALKQLVHQHVNVNLGQIVRLSGTRTRATVYRVHFSLASDATDNNGNPYSILPDALRLVIKEGSIESLSRTIKRYSELPSELRPYFAKHADQPESSGQSQEWYLVMEDLVGMTPLSEMLDRVDLHGAGRPQNTQIARAAAAVAEALSALHRHQWRKPIASNELGWLYLNPIAEALNRLCEPGAFPELKPCVENGVESNGWRYHNLNLYLAQLARHADRLTPPAIGAVHGDCHSRNLMIDSGLKWVKFVDIETLSYADDYLADYGLLIEDVALYRYLPRGQRPNCLTSDEIVTRQGQIHYPFLPRQADSILLFQKCLIEQIEKFAAQSGDTHFRPRLWLAIARNLILLASRQIATGPLDPQRREDTLKLVFVAYAEAIRLMDELLAYLDAADKASLPPLPFTGKALPRAKSAFPLEILHEAILQLDHSITHRQAASARHITAYSVDHKPFAELDRQADPPTLTLAGRLEQYVDAASLAKPAASGIAISLSPNVSLDAVLGLVRQAYFLALAD